MPRLGDDPINIEAYYTEDGEGKSGLTVTFTLLDPGGNVEQTGSLVATSIVGLYRYNATADIDEAGQWTFEAATTSSDVDQKEMIGRVDVEPALATDAATIGTAVWAVGTRTLTSFGTLVADVKAAVLEIFNTAKTSFTTAGSYAKYVIDQLARIGQWNAVVVGRVQTASIIITRGDDHFERSGNELSFVRDFDLWGHNVATDTEIRITVRKRNAKTGRGEDTVWFTKTDTAGSRVGADSGDQTVVFEPDHDDTADVEPGTLAGVYDIQCTTADGDIVTVETGTVQVVEDQTRAS